MRLPSMKISTRIFLAYVSLSVVLGAATLTAGYLSLGALVEGIVKEDVQLLAWELGLFMLPQGADSFASMKEPARRALQEQIHLYVIRSDRIASLEIIGEDGRILFANDRRRVGGKIVGPEELAQIHSGEPSVRPVHGGAGNLYEISVPIRSALRGNLGTLRARVRSQYFTTYLDEPRKRFLWYFIAFVAAITLSGVAVATVFSVPVRRLNRALLDLQAKHFRGAAPAAGVDEVTGALQAVSQMGERIEAMARGARRQEVALSSLSRALDEGVAILDLSGHVISANPAAAAILRVEGAADPARGVQDVLESKAALSGLVEDVLASERDVKGRDVELKGPADRPIGVRVSAYLLRDPDMPAGVLLVLRDLGSIRTLEQDLQEASRLSVLAKLTASVAHEIKNPLNSMVINMEVLRGLLQSLPENVRADSERYVRVVTGEIFRLDKVIRDFLGLTNPPDLTPAPTDVNQLISRVADLIQYEAHTARVTIQCDLQERLPLVPAVPVRLAQAFLNVSLNAIQAMGGGGTLRIRTHAEEKAVRVDFEDTGPGVSPEIEEKIFDFHFSTKETGTGLGLSITKLILEAQGGGIRFRNRPGGGAVFSILLPAPSEVASTV